MKHPEALIGQYFGSVLGSDALDVGVASRLLAFAETLSNYDRANVIGTGDLYEIVGEHVLDSLSCLQVPFYVQSGRLVDVGSGAGLPGIPLAIVSPEKNFTLVDSVGKKTRFQETARSMLGLENVVSVNRRIEEIGKDRAHRGGYDIATSRALASLDVVAEYCLPLVRVGGAVISMKGRLNGEEVSRGEAAADRLGGVVRGVYPVRRLDSQVEKERHLVVMEKLRETPSRYPRDVGVPAKKPLGEERG